MKKERKKKIYIYTGKAKVVIPYDKKLKLSHLSKITPTVMFSSHSEGFKFSGCTLDNKAKKEKKSFLLLMNNGLHFTQQAAL